VLIACPTCGRLQFDMDTVVADIERRLEAYADPSRSPCSAARSTASARRRTPTSGSRRQERGAHLLARQGAQEGPAGAARRRALPEIDKYTQTKRIDVDATRAGGGAAWLERIEEENAGELTPERLAKLEAESARADADAMDEVLNPRLDEAESPTAGRRFTRARVSS
jgi:(E)-4-hydroxy-3-methylbut-2-enyl-diphosphate synthase